MPIQKRPAADEAASMAPPQKKGKLFWETSKLINFTNSAHPFFSGGNKDKELGKFLPSPGTLIHYLHLDPFVSSSPASSSTSVAATNSTSSSSTSTSSAPKVKKIKITFYDLDGTLIKTKSGASFPKSREDWIWWHPSVPAKLKKEWEEEGRHIIVISNQGDSRDKIRNEWRAKLPLIAAKMPAGVPIRILAALSMNDVYRKPNIGMFETVVQLYKSHNLEIDMEKSIFIGDAAGRLAKGPQRKDHGDTDYKFALNTKLRFYTPEEHFLGHARPIFPEPPNGFIPSKLGNLAALPHIVPSHKPIIPLPSSSTPTPLNEMVVFVGPPASGKSSFYRKHFAPNGYQHVNQDILGSRDKCLRVAEAFLKEGKSVVVDNTNRNRDTRAVWVALASKLNIPIRLFHFLCPLELAKHNNVYRACYSPPNEPPRTLLPLSAFTSYAAAFEPPTIDEGFDELRAVNFHFEGTEEQRTKWDMYMLEPRR